MIIMSIMCNVTNYFLFLDWSPATPLLSQVLRSRFILRLLVGKFFWYCSILTRSMTYSWPQMRVSSCPPRLRNSVSSSSLFRSSKRHQPLRPS